MLTIKDIQEKLAAYEKDHEGWLITYVPPGGVIVDEYIADNAEAAAERAAEIMADNPLAFGIDAVVETEAVVPSVRLPQ